MSTGRLEPRASRYPDGSTLTTIGWYGQGEAELLASCYRRSLELARDTLCDSIAFPAISTGVYGYPLEAACRVAVEAVYAFVSENDAPRKFVVSRKSSMV